MKSFALVPTSEGPRREFKITWGLRTGYGPSGRIYDLEEAIRAAHGWMRESVRSTRQRRRTSPGRLPIQASHPISGRRVRSGSGPPEKPIGGDGGREHQERRSALQQ